VEEVEVEYVPPPPPWWKGGKGSGKGRKEVWSEKGSWDYDPYMDGEYADYYEDHHLDQDELYSEYLEKKYGPPRRDDYPIGEAAEPDDDLGEVKMDWDDDDIEENDYNVPQEEDRYGDEEDDDFLD